MSIVCLVFELIDCAMLNFILNTSFSPNPFADKNHYFSTQFVYLYEFATKTTDKKVLLHTSQISCLKYNEQSHVRVLIEKIIVFLIQSFELSC